MDKKRMVVVRLPGRMRGAFMAALIFCGAFASRQKRHKEKYKKKELME